ncbi:MAG: DNA mismatch repair protein MutS [Myxococcota bacterium]
MPDPRPPQSPRDDYETRLTSRRDAVTRLARWDGRIANARLLAFLIFVATALAFWAVDKPRLDFAALWIALPAAGFFALLVWHDSVLRAKARADKAVAYYELGLARIDDAWQGRGNQHADFVGDDHPYAADLDLFGNGSLFELLGNARTRAGEQTLAGWLAAPAPIATVRARQTAVEELRDRVDLREELVLLGGDVRACVHPDTLIAWSAAPPIFSPTLTRLVCGSAVALTLAVVAAFVLWATTSLGPLPLVGVALLEWGYLRLLRDRLAIVTAGTQQPEEELAVLVRILDRLELEPMKCEHLVALERALTADGVKASKSIRQLGRRLAWFNSQRNQFFAPFAFLLVWKVHFGMAIEAWRIRHGKFIARWLDALGEIEALSDLACYAYEHPEDPFPELLEGKARFDGVALGHPLLTQAECVRNSVRLDDDNRLLIVSGSNMSGKTTLLRTVGVNVVLALAGAPVRAKHLALTPLAIGATLRINDSIHKGTSRFFAEIERLRDFMGRADNGAPLLFLLDEVLHGTNSHDRRVGAEAVVRGFVERGGIGLMTTHDLALTEIAKTLGAGATNVHFADHLVGGKLSFDYRVRDGVVQKSNALELMRSVGIRV